MFLQILHYPIDLVAIASKPDVNKLEGECSESITHPFKIHISFKHSTMCGPSYDVQDGGYSIN